MREKVILQDFTVLLVCPSQKWSTVERRVLFDSTFLRNMGCNPVILCFKNSQIDIEAESEDISRVYINSRVNIYLGIFKFLLELKSLIKEKRFDIVHCYSLFPMWPCAFILGSQPQTPLFLTFNQNQIRKPGKGISKWLMGRLDYIFTLSREVEDNLQLALPVRAKKLRSLGVGVEFSSIGEKGDRGIRIGCVINNLEELKGLHFPVKTFRLLKDHSVDKFENVELFIFLGPRVFKTERSKQYLAELDYEFYKGDIHLVSLKIDEQRLKNIDIFFGTAFDEPVNDFEISSILKQIPVLFPRSSTRQAFLQNYGAIGESYMKDDLREARGKLLKILENLDNYKKKLKEKNEKLLDSHGLESYALRLQNYYETAFAKRARLFKKKRTS